LLNAKSVTPLLFEKQIAFNLLPCVGGSGERGSADIDLRMADDVRKVLHRPTMNLSVGCCWVPVFFGHTQFIDIRFASPQARDRLRELLANVSDVSLFDTSDSYPTAVTEASGTNGLLVGRISSATPSSQDFSIWTVADNLRFGVAGNALKSIEVLVKDYL
jgi:aspartate-semialdehyde dehydrogenase